MAKTMCLNPDGCDQEIDLEKESEATDCPKCHLNNKAIINRDRHDRALDKLKASRGDAPPELTSGEKKEKKLKRTADPWGIV